MSKRDLYIKPVSKTDDGVTWERPVEWLPIPTIQPGEEVIYLLMTIMPEGENRISFFLEGDYTVDWGDGTIENYNSATRALRDIDFNSVPSSSTLTNGDRQALIKITPQAANNLTLVDFNRRDFPNQATGRSTTVVDMVLNIPNCTTLILGGTVIRQKLVERVKIPECAITDCTNLFTQFLNLRKVELGAWTSNVTTMEFMFSLCVSLGKIDWFDMSSNTDCRDMFVTCRSLRVVPGQGNTQPFNTSNVTRFQGMFAFCGSLEEAPMMDTSSANIINAMFQECVSLRDVPLYDFSNATTTPQVFDACRALQTVPQFNLSSATSLLVWFRNCQSLTEIPPLSIPNVTTIQTLIQNVAAPITKIELYDCGNITNTTNFFNNTSRGLKRAIFQGLRIGIVLSDNHLSDSALNDLMTSLGTANGSQTLDIRTNPGSATCDITIAQAKGWTVLN
jgi:hypothetical protein